eukprot:CAMPEP_0178432020 /NCGR_PEP_ID=MMETSP0689_2-20121128/32162_1 /TAXON_ID=160604 /ORGANISM="Amphidinium massartii, Strain CS-259" /LENGTH=323 /DNA_ID=CAMNT_0020053979 /DNA_START=98 /DNA_END=1066 /DNA_ORIENTATION=+
MRQRLSFCLLFTAEFLVSAADGHAKHESFLARHHRDASLEARAAVRSGTNAGKWKETSGHVNDVPSYEVDGPNRLDGNFWTSSSMSLDLRKIDDLEPVAPMDTLVHSVPAPESPYRWEKHTLAEGDEAANTPVHKSGLDPAKMTASLPSNMARSQHYWIPKIQDGPVAPLDHMPHNAYPSEAVGDRITVAAREDRVAAPFARYFDQLEQRALICDTVSDDCVVPCRAGDQVTMQVGNTKFDATVVSPNLANVLTIRFRTDDDEGGPFAQQVLGVQASDNAFRQVGRVWNEVQLNGTIIRIDCRQGERVQVAQSDVARLNRWSV